MSKVITFIHSRSESGDDYYDTYDGMCSYERAQHYIEEQYPNEVGEDPDCPDIYVQYLLFKTVDD